MRLDASGQDKTDQAGSADGDHRSCCASRLLSVVLSLSVSLSFCLLSSSTVNDTKRFCHDVRPRTTVAISFDGCVRALGPRSS